MSKADDALHIGGNLVAAMMLITIVLCAARILFVVNNKINYSNTAAVYNKVNCYSSYENQVVTGDKVQHFIDAYSDTLFIRVCTLEKSSGFFGKNLECAHEIESPFYVDHSDKFYCSMIKDQNGDIIGANFEQFGIVLSESDLTAAISDCKTELGE